MHERYWLWCSLFANNAKIIENVGMQNFVNNLLNSKGISQNKEENWQNPLNGFLFLFENLISGEQFWGLKFPSLDSEFGGLSKKFILMFILLNVGHSNVQGQKFGKKYE